MPPQRRKLGGHGTAKPEAKTLLDEATTAPVSPLRDAQWTSNGAVPSSETIVAATPTAAAELPEVYAQPDATGALNDKERADLAACEGALDTLRVAFWRAGKALTVIRDAKLYRETHDTFEQYVSDRWQIRSSHAYRLIASATIAEPIALSPIGDKVNEGQVRELLPVASQHGDQAAAELYLTLAKELEGGPRITADLVRKAATAITSALPAGSAWDSETVAEIVHTALYRPQPQDDDEPRPLFASEGDRMAALADKVAKRAQKHPDEARAFAAALEEHGRRIRAALGE